MSDVCAGLGHAHRHGVVHRDIKPSNIHVLPDGRAKLMDFGIAKLRDSEELTAQGVVMGTVQYMAPEQLLGGTVDQRSDIFSLGVVLYELISGRRPFGEGEPEVLLYRIVNEAPRPVDKSDPRLELAEVILERALAKAPEDRYQSCDGLARTCPG